MYGFAIKANSHGCFRGNAQLKDEGGIPESRADISPFWSGSSHAGDWKSGLTGKYSRKVKRKTELPL